MFLYRKDSNFGISLTLLKGINSNMKIEDNNKKKEAQGNYNINKIILL